MARRGMPSATCVNNSAACWVPRAPLAELHALIAEHIDEADEQAEAELLRQGQGAMPAIMARFPGPITADLARAAEGAIRVADVISE